MPTVIDRNGWGARDRKYLVPISKSEGVFVHHSVTAEGGAETVRAIQNYHMNTRGWSDIAYSWLVAADGTIYEGRGWGVQGGHTLGWNSKSHAVCYIGNTDNNFTDAAKKSINWLIEEHNRRYGNGFVKGHRDVGVTGCPGAQAYAWVQAGRPDPTSPAPAPTPPPAPAPAPVPAPPLGNLDQVIYKNSHKVHIREVQKLLAFWGLYPKNQIDGIYGPKTEAGVKQLQVNIKSAGIALVADGVWGPKTYAAFKKWLAQQAAPPTPPIPPAQHSHYKHQKGRILQRGVKGADVSEWQFLMNVSNGSDRAHWVTVDGDFGPQTERATIRFQQIYSTFFKKIDVDGKVGPQTLAAMEHVLHEKDIWE